MNLILLVFLVLVFFGVAGYFARQIAAPWQMAAYGFLFVIAVLVILALIGVVPVGHANWRV